MNRKNRISYLFFGVLAIGLGLFLIALHFIDPEPHFFYPSLVFIVPGALLLSLYFKNS